MLNQLNKLGYRDFREGQEEIIKSVLNEQDTFAMLPTGRGKTLCYHLPAKMMSGLVLVISPLISLMNDQVTQMKANGERRVNLLTSLQSYSEKNDVLRALPQLDLLYVSPEMLSLESMQHRLKKQRISLLVVDEAHCVSQWGHEFRPEYQKIGHYAEQLGRPPILALTATATDVVEKDILKQLRMKQTEIFRHSVNRANIFLDVIHTSSKSEKKEFLLSETEKAGKPCIIYAGTRHETEKTAEMLKEYRTAYYHGGMSGEDRSLVQAQFLYDEIDILVATNAFGMGINKSNVRTVMHTHMPSSFEQYTQEIGRAGRDGQASKAVLLFHPSDIQLPLNFLSSEFPEEGWLLKSLLPFVRSSRNTEEVRIELQAPDALWRMVTSHLQEEGLITGGAFSPNQHTESILGALEKRYAYRKQEKMKQLTLMKQFIHEKECFRTALMNLFGESAPLPSEFACCSLCSTEPLWKEEAPIEPQGITLSWEEKLQKLLFPEKGVL